MSLLSVRNLSAFYGSFQALFDVSLEADEGETVAVIGANGAGKTTFLRSVAGVLPVPASAVRFAGDPVGGRPAHELVDRGVVMVPEGRRIFPSLTVEENLLVGAYRGRPGGWTLARVYELFPVLAERRRQPGTNLSGGEQQMLAIGRGLMGNPRLLLVDEISLGLAPVVVQRPLPGPPDDRGGRHHRARGRPGREPDHGAGPARLLLSQGHGLARGPAGGPDARPDRRRLLRSVTVKWGA